MMGILTPAARLAGLLRPGPAVAAFLLLAGCRGGGDGQIRVGTQPEGARIVCNGVTYEGSPVTISRLPVGAYLISAVKDGYAESRRTVSLLENGQKVAVEIKLEPQTALALVHSEPEGADVTVDGAYRGRTPFFLTDLPFGEHRFSFSLAGHLPREIAAAFKDRVPQKILAELSINAGRVVVRSQPEGATVRLNGVDRGVTPCEIPDAPSGDHTIEVAKEGFEPHVEKFAVRAQETREVSAVLKALPTVLNVVSIPSGARIYVDNQYRGDAPLKLTDLPPGPHRLRAELRGFDLSTREVQVTAQSDVVEEFRMQKNSGKIVLVTEPAGVKVFLNGEESGVTVESAENPLVSAPLELDTLPPGNYRVQLHRTGYLHAPRSVTIAANQIVDLHEKLLRRFIPDTRIRVRGESGEIMREGMLLRKFPNGDVELQLETGTIMKILAAEILSQEPLRGGPPPPPPPPPGP